MMRSTHHALVLVLTLALAACATKPPAPAVPDAQLSAERQARILQLQHWTLTGRVAIRLEREAWSASMHWSQQEQQYTLRFMAPLARGTWELSGQPGAVTLLTAENRLLAADTPEALLRQNMGWELPVSGLRYWVLGIPEPDRDIAKMIADEKGRLMQLEQSGWSVVYDRYMTVEGLDLPQKLTLWNSKLKVRLVVSRWIVPA